MADAAAVISERESEVLAAVADHLTNAEIAQRLHISVRTVESHVSSLLRKLQLPDRRALAGYASGLSELRCDDPAGGSSLQGAPAALSSFVGRDADVAAAVEALAAARLVSLVGPGGVGKTRLAVEAGSRVAAGFAGGAWFVDLVPVRAAGVATALAGALGVVDRPNQSLEDVVRESLRARRALLVVDNCEHVLEVVAPLLERLLLACPGLQVLATSRELLAVAGERVVAVAPLDEVDAVRLFGERARLLDPDFDVEANHDEVADVCARLDGLPLAIELASARCAVLGLDGVRAGLADRLGLLASTRSPDERHRSLRQVLDWSHDLLDPTEQAVLRRLGAFAGDFTIDDATAVVGEVEGPVVDAVARLTAKSLLVRRSRGDVTTYRLLEAVHEYAEERLATSGDLDAVRHRHLAWAGAAVRAIEERLDTGEGWRHRFAAVADDVRAALGWSQDDPGAAVEAHRLARAHAHVAYARRLLGESQATYELAARLAADPAEGAADLRAAAAVGYARMRGDLAYDLYLAAAVLGAEADPNGAAGALADAVSLAWRCPAEFPEALPAEVVGPLLDRARALDRGDDLAITARLAVAESWRPVSEVCGGDLDLARVAVRAARELDDPVLLSCALDSETSALWGQGFIGAAARVVDERMALLDRMVSHDPRSGGEVMDAFHMAADTALAAGHLRDGLDRAMLMRKDELGETSPHAATREAVVALTLLGRFADAIAEADTMRHDWELAGRPSARWMLLGATAAELAHGLVGDHDSALEWRAVAREINGGELPSPIKREFAAFADARLALHEGRLDDAARHAAEWDPANPSSYVGYVASLQAEIAVVRGADDAVECIEDAERLLDENVWGRAFLLRARGRLKGDESVLRQALAAFDDLDARFEWAVTGLLLGGSDAARGVETLDSLGVALPAAE